MATTHYCNVHGEYNVYDGSSGGCPDCQYENSLNERARSESAVRAAYLTNNPGDYECPACKMVSLKYCASRCPKCQADVTSDFWGRIQEQERSERERRQQAEEKRQKWLASPEHAAELKLKAEHEKVAELEKLAKESELETAKYWRRFRILHNLLMFLSAIFFGPLLGCLIDSSEKDFGTVIAIGLLSVIEIAVLAGCVVRFIRGATRARHVLHRFFKSS